MVAQALIDPPSLGRNGWQLHPVVSETMASVDQGNGKVNSAEQPWLLSRHRRHAAALTWRKPGSSLPP
jgi:hypothetical protein